MVFRSKSVSSSTHGAWDEDEEDEAEEEEEEEEDREEEEGDREEELSSEAAEEEDADEEEEEADAGGGGEVGVDEGRGEQGSCGPAATLACSTPEVAIILLMALRKKSTQKDGRP